MTMYKKYLFDPTEKGPFFKPDLSQFDHPVDVAFHEREEARLKEVYTPLKKSNNLPFTNLDVAFNSAEIRNGGKYLFLSFTTKEGALEGKVWPNRGIDFDEAVRDLEPGRVYSISGKWNEWPAGSGKYSAIVESFLPSSATPDSLVSYVNENIADLQKEVRFYVSTMSEHIQDLATSLLDQVWGAFSMAPAAKGHHHFQLGGLLQHTVELLRIAHHMLDKNAEEAEETLFYVRRLVEAAVRKELKKHRDEAPESRFFSSFYEPQDHMLMTFHKMLMAWEKEPPNRDVVLFSILFHDIGKIMEYSYANEPAEKYELVFPGMAFEHLIRSIGVSMDPNGSRIGHITLGMMMLNQHFVREESPEGDFLLNVLACISAHHGKTEWGSPTCPSTTNEYLVHICDYLDAKFASEK